MVTCPILYTLPTTQETVNTGPFVMRSTCRRCGGKGTVISNPCHTCRGTGQTKQRKTVTVPVPAGPFTTAILNTTTPKKSNKQQLTVERVVLLGVEDGQTVRMPVGKKEIFITFRVSGHMGRFIAGFFKNKRLTSSM